MHAHAPVSRLFPWKSFCLPWSGKGQVMIHLMSLGCKRVCLVEAPVSRESPTVISLWTSTAMFFFYQSCTCFDSSCLGELIVRADVRIHSKSKPSQHSCLQATLRTQCLNHFSDHSWPFSEKPASGGWKRGKPRKDLYSDEEIQKNGGIEFHIDFCLFSRVGIASPGHISVHLFTKQKNFIILASDFLDDPLLV